MRLIASKIGLYHRFWTWLSRALRLSAYYGEPTKIVNKGGCHHDAFLNTGIYTADASQKIIAAIKSYIGL